MSKKRVTKKRNKPYQGADSSSAQPRVHRYVAQERGPVKEWWYEKKRPIKIGSIIASIILFISLIISGIVGIVT